MILLVFESTHDALMAEQALINNDYQLRIIPTPRAFSNSCGLSIRVKHGNWSNIKKIFAKLGISGYRYCDCLEENGKYTYGELKE